jgi:hypothetical protein
MASMPSVHWVGVKCDSRSADGRVGAVVDEDVGVDASAEEGGGDAADGAVSVDGGEIAGEVLAAGGPQSRFGGELVDEVGCRAESWRGWVGLGELDGEGGFDGAAVEPGMRAGDGDSA